MIIRLSAMGDIVHGLPVAAYLKENLPGLELSWMVEAAGIPLLEGNPAVDRVIVFPKKKWLQQLNSVSGIAATASEASNFISSLKSLKFDAVIDLQGLFKSSILAYLSGAARRFGFKGTREGADRLLTHVLDAGDYFGSNTHVVELNLRLAEYTSQILLDLKTGNDSSINGLAKNIKASFPLPQPAAGNYDRLRALLGQSGSNQVVKSPVLALVPGTTWQSKIWPAEKWIELSKLLLLEKVPGPILLIGGAGEENMNREIAASAPDKFLNLTGKTGILDLIAIFQESDIVIGTDSGPVHLAAATGKPVVLSIFGSTPPLRNGPYGSHCSTVSLDLSCQPCFKKVCPLKTLACLKDLSAMQVFETIKSSYLLKLSDD